MNPSSLLYLPDALAMLVLMVILYALRLQSRAREVTLWLLGLSLVLLEALSADVYHLNIPALRTPSHVVALASFVLAGLTFAWVARRDTLPRTTYGSLCLTITTPLLLLTVVYGLNVQSVLAYKLLIAAGFLAQCAWMAATLRRPRTLLLVAAITVAGWTPVLWFAVHTQFRASVYYGVGFLYLLVAAALSRLVRRSRIGAIVVIGGFLVWAACLFAHPFFRPSTVAYEFVELVWTMQKFFVTIGLVLVLLDEERRHNHELALYDALTGLPNRRLFDDRLSQAVQRSNRSAIPFALFNIDLDGFKAINDLFGHAYGDAVLREAAVALAKVVRSSDTLARCGGDEFAVIVNEITRPELCDRIAADLRNALTQATLPGANPITLSGSVGYAFYPTEARTIAALQQLADQRMYEQKDLTPNLTPA